MWNVILYYYERLINKWLVYFVFEDFVKWKVMFYENIIVKVLLSDCGDLIVIRVLFLFSCGI